MDKDFDTWFAKKKEEERKLMNQLPYTVEELLAIYRQEFEQRKNKPSLKLKMGLQSVNYEMVRAYLPEKWEMVHEGKLLYDDEELIGLLHLLIYNLGLKQTLDSLSFELIEEYVKDRIKV